MEHLVWGTSGLGRGTRPGSREADDAVELATEMIGSGLPIDTSHNYADGRSEEVLGTARKASPEPPGTIFTKVDAQPDGRFDREVVLRCVATSLERLGADHLPIVHLHDPYSITIDEALAPRGAVAGLTELRDQGVIGSIGIAAGPLALTTEYVMTGAFDAVLNHNRYTLVHRGASDLWQQAKERGMRTFNAAPFGGSLLVKGPLPAAKYAYRPAPEPLRRWVEQVAGICVEYGVELPVAALRFSLDSPLVDSTIVGVSSIRQLRGIRRWSAVKVPADLWPAIESIGPAPIPKELHD